MNQFSSETALDARAERQRRFWIQFSDLNWWIVLLAYTAAALLSAGTVYTSDLAERSPVPFYYPLLWELTGHYTILLLVPLIIIGFSRLPITKRNWFWSIPVHLVLSVVFGAVHTLLMLYTRRYLYWLFELGSYDYGHMGYRFLMEYHKQFIHYWAVYVVLRALAHYRLSREHEKQAGALRLRTSELEKQLALVQLQALRSQLNPHFLFNTLNMISAVMYEDANRADHMLAALSRMLRLSLEENVGARVPLRRELEFVDCAVELIRARFQDRAAINVVAAPDLLEQPVPNMVLHTLVENAIKHHRSGSDPIIRVDARIARHDSLLEIDVVDNGPGVADPKAALANGVGLSNLRRRLEGLYGSRHSLTIQNRPEGGLRVHVTFPLEQTPALQKA